MRNDDSAIFQKEFADKRENEDNVEKIIANPIHVYKLIKEMQQFAEEVYQPLLNMSSNTGIQYLIVKLMKKLFSTFTIIIKMLFNLFT